MKQILISAGEASGDMHAAAVVVELRRRLPEVRISGIAGSQMQAAGCRALHDVQALNVMGIGSVLASLSRIRQIEQSLLAWCEQERPELAVLVDFSSFHMRLGRKLRQLGIPVIHYIAPKLWAWGSWRVAKLRRSQDRLACILPFEPEWFSGHGIEAAYVGNPSAFACQRGWSRQELREHLGIGPETPLLALLPGSRPQELKMHLPVLVESWRRLRQQLPEAACVVPVAPGVSRQALAPLWQAGALPVERQAPGYALRADAAIAVSGTATLELALWDVPTVLVYRAPPLTMFLARRLVGLECAGLANIILGDRPVMPELIQEACRPEKIVGNVLPLLQNQEAARQQRQEFARLRDLLGDANPAVGVADMAELLSR